MSAISTPMKRLKLAVVVLVFGGSLYLGSYFYLSRRGLQEADQLALEGFLYVQVSTVLETKDLSRHRQLRRLYMPLNSLDRTWLGTPGPTLGITWGPDSD